MHLADGVLDAALSRRPMDGVFARIACSTTSGFQPRLTTIRSTLTVGSQIVLPRARGRYFREILTEEFIGANNLNYTLK